MTRYLTLQNQHAPQGYPIPLQKLADSPSLFLYLLAKSRVFFFPQSSSPARFNTVESPSQKPTSHPKHPISAHYSHSSTTTGFLSISLSSRNTKTYIHTPPILFFPPPAQSIQPRSKLQGISPHRRQGRDLSSVRIKA